MALIAVAADKGAPGVTTTALALAAAWPRPVLLAECDPAGGDIVYRLPGAGGGRLDPRRGLLSLAVAARRGLTPAQVREHVQKLRGGLDVLLGVTTAEQGSGLDPLWDAIGGALAALPQADVIADCGRLGPDGPYYELLARAAAVVLVVRPSLGEVVRLRDRAATLSAAVCQRGGRDGRVGLLVVVDHRGFAAALAEVGHAVSHRDGPASVLGAVAYEPKSAELLRGEWGGKLRKSLLIRTAGEVAGRLVSQLPTAAQPAAAGWPVAGQHAAANQPYAAGQPAAGPAEAAEGSHRAPRPAGARRARAAHTGPFPQHAGQTDPTLTGASRVGPVNGVPRGRSRPAWSTPLTPAGWAGPAQAGPEGGGPPAGSAPQSTPPWPVLDGTDPRPTIPPYAATPRPRHAAGPPDRQPPSGVPDRQLPSGVVPVDGSMPSGAMPARGPEPAADLAPLPAPPELARPGLARPGLGRPDMARSDVVHPDVARPDPAHPDVALPRRGKATGRGRHAQPRDGRAADRQGW